MNDNPTCPVCSSQSWDNRGHRTYHRADRQRGARPYRNAMEVLFDVWAPGQDAFRVEFIACRNCGFLTYSPRPTADDIARKYRHTPSDSARDAPAATAALSRQDVRRARRLTRLILGETKAKSTRGLRVLDFGGGDGRMLGGLVDRGALCHLVDYSERVHPGVTKIGDTEHDIPADANYDVIICSHVVEHLPDPRETLATLREALAPDGIIYVEVPIEVVGQLPATHEPVTHLNFFTPDSLRALLAFAGYGVSWSRLVAEPHPWGYKQLCAGAVATPAAIAPEDVPVSGLDVLEPYLDGAYAVRAKRRWVLGLEKPDMLRKGLRKLPILWRYS